MSSRFAPIDGVQVTKHPLYRLWFEMKRRCLNKDNPNYKNYGGRGIAVSKEWMSFHAFVKDMGPRPSPKHSIDRIDNNKGYSKENCRWATFKTQANNKRTNALLTYNGVTKNITEWSEITGIKMATIYNRHFRLKMPIDAVLSPGRHPNGKRRKKITVNGFTGTIKEVAERLGVNEGAIYHRIWSGMTPQEAFKKPIAKKDGPRIEWGIYRNDREKYWSK